MIGIRAGAQRREAQGNDGEVLNEGAAVLIVVNGLRILRQPRQEGR